MALKAISPVDGRVYVERPLAEGAQIAAALDAARTAQRAWRATALAERQAIIERFVAAMEAKKAELGAELSWQMGRPVRYTPNEIGGGMAERARYMAAAAGDALADVKVEPKAGFTRFIRHEALGVVFVIAPWNYPYLTA